MSLMEHRYNVTVKVYGETSNVTREFKKMHRKQLADFAERVLLRADSRGCFNIRVMETRKTGSE